MTKVWPEVIVLCAGVRNVRLANSGRDKAMGSMTNRRTTRKALVSGLAVLLFAATASAETLLMPKRDYLMGTSEVVWGGTTQANGTAMVIDFGDGTQSAPGTTVGDRSYIAFNHTYAISGPL